MEEMISEKERKEIEKLLYELSNLQVMAGFLASKNLKGEDLEKVIQIDGQPVSVECEMNNIAVSFSETTKKLSKILRNPAIEKTMNKISQSNIYNREMVEPYLNQLLKEMKSVSETTKRIIDTENVKKQMRQQQEKFANEQTKLVQVVSVQQKSQVGGKIVEEKEMKISK